MEFFFIYWEEMNFVFPANQESSALRRCFHCSRSSKLQPWRRSPPTAAPRNFGMSVMVRYITYRKHRTRCAGNDFVSNTGVESAVEFFSRRQTQNDQIRSLSLGIGEQFFHRISHFDHKAGLAPLFGLGRGNLDQLLISCLHQCAAVALERFFLRDHVHEREVGAALLCGG